MNSQALQKYLLAIYHQNQMVNLKRMASELLVVER
ncbi:hypothetical protein STM14_3502 [Salmonella enterica subsp. enterica serovar Typhimurium str. 14028S]|uniref:Uncharacterized protein n=2 Tax=Salmonella enterica I TaxID=59201 RepID=A0A0F6B5X0_SALT1|nr:hypothetical protein SPAB_03608 [Salmonella enterica subsp. enterica serovar Paratyphi B str. SPB7]ACY89916.1 hypothetical protein STM14_3502 [Salmonella enterica subsp. enterica serovar Typhimurium str. 14028S]